MSSKSFAGFSPEAINFIDQWRQNNSRDWFQPRKADYEKLIKEPALDFIDELGNKLKLLSRDINFDLSNNGSLLRIYRDIRFSQDKRPYNPNIRIVFWEGPRKKTENPGFFIKVDQKGAAVFAGKYMFSTSILNAYRDAVVHPKLGTELLNSIAAIKKAGDYMLGGEYYKRLPRGYNAEAERAELLKYNGLYAMTSNISVAEVLTADLVDVCFEHCVNLRPLQAWLVKIVMQKF